MSTALYVELALGFSDSTWRLVAIEVSLPDDYMSDAEVSKLALKQADILYGDMDGLRFIHPLSVEPRSTSHRVHS